MYSLKYLAYMAYMTNLVAILVSETYMAITHKLDIAVGCILAYECKNVGSIYPFINNGCVTQSCNVVVIFVWPYMSYVYSNVWSVNLRCLRV